jgi:subtilase family serine protease
MLKNAFIALCSPRHFTAQRTPRFPGWTRRPIAPTSASPEPTASTPTGYTPQQMQHAYGVDQIANQGAGQIIGIVDGYDYASVESDLGVFTTQFGLPACTKPTDA